MNYSEADRERISAALDGALSSQDQVAFDADLAADPALNAEWAELNLTRALLQELPTITPPRSFTLDPHQYGRRSIWQHSWLRFSGVLGALFLIFALSFIYLNISSSNPDPMVTMNEQPESAAYAPEVPAGGAAAATEDSSARLSVQEELLEPTEEAVALESADDSMADLPAENADPMTADAANSSSASDLPDTDAGMPSGESQAGVVIRPTQSAQSDANQAITMTEDQLYSMAPSSPGTHDLATPEAAVGKIADSQVQPTAPTWPIVLISIGIGVLVLVGLVLLQRRLRRS